MTDPVSPPAATPAPDDPASRDPAGRDAAAHDPVAHDVELGAATAAMTPDAIPAALRDEISAQHWQRVPPSNDRPTEVWMSEQLVVKIGLGLRAEAQRLEWLHHHGSAPAVRFVEDDPQREGWAWLVMERLAGAASHRVEDHGDVNDVARTIGSALRALHDTVVGGDFPFEHGWEALEAEIVGNDQIDPAELPDPYRRYDAARLVELWRQGRPEVEELVLCHGDPSMPNIIVDPAFVGWIDVGRLRVADRHLDLAIAHHSVHRNLGPAAVFGLYDGYGQPPDLVRLDHYVLAMHLTP